MLDRITSDKIKVLNRAESIVEYWNENKELSQQYRTRIIALHFYLKHKGDIAMFNRAMRPNEREWVTIEEIEKVDKWYQHNALEGMNWIIVVFSLDRVEYEKNKYFGFKFDMKRMFPDHMLDEKRFAPVLFLHRKYTPMGSKWSYVSIKSWEDIERINNEHKHNKQG